MRFLSTLSLRRATTGIFLNLASHKHFYPRSPCGERLRSIRKSTTSRDFYPRSPCGERHEGTLHCLRVMRISIHALLAESDSRRYPAILGCVISIHALLAESDRLCTILYSSPGNFYPRSPCGERRKSNKLAGPKLVFLSTLSLRRATVEEVSGDTWVRDFYPRSPCGERPVVYDIVLKPGKFLSTLSLRRATQIKQTCRAEISISIHALLAESDKPGERHASSQQEFLSTLSLRRATAKVHKTMGHFCTYETNFMGIASSC